MMKKHNFKSFQINGFRFYMIIKLKSNDWICVSKQPDCLRPMMNLHFLDWLYPNNDLEKISSKILGKYFRYDANHFKIFSQNEIRYYVINNIKISLII